MRVLVTGSRDLTDYDTVADELDDLWLIADKDYPFVVVHGGARGADSLAGRWCKAAIAGGFNVIEEVHPADWSKGKVAGIQRNQKMVELGADVCLAFPRGVSRGTRDCIERALNYGIRVIYG